MPFKSLRKAPVGQAQAPAAAKPSAFGFDDDADDHGSSKAEPAAVEIGTFDEDTIDSSAPVASRGKTDDSKTRNSLIPGIPSGSSTISRETSKIMAQAEAEDATVFDYDANYEKSSTAAAQALRRVEAKAEADARKPKYVTGMSAAASVRQRDQLRARDKLLQKERETEGDEYGEKETFVTGAYKAQQEEVRRAEEEERRREEEEDKNAAGQGMRQFWKGVLKDDADRHQNLAALASNGGTKLDIHEQKERDQVAAEMARQLNAKGGNVEINDEGQVADKRQLLSAGLNVTARLKSSSNSAEQHNSHLASRPAQNKGNMGRNARDAMRERQTRMVEAQLEAAQKRAAEEEAEELQKRERSAKSQKTSTDVSSARERYLQRKKEAAEAKARGDPP